MPKFTVYFSMNPHSPYPHIAWSTSLEAPSVDEAQLYAKERLQVLTEDINNWQVREW